MRRKSQSDTEYAKKLIQQGASDQNAEQYFDNLGYSSGQIAALLSKASSKKYTASDVDSTIHKTVPVLYKNNSVSAPANTSTTSASPASASATVATIGAPASNNSYFSSTPEKGSTASSEVDKWINPSYKMTKQDKARAKQYISYYYKSDTFRNRFKTPYTDAQDKEYEKVISLDNKIKPGASFMAGMASAASAIPFLKQAGKAIDKTSGNNNMSNFDNSLKTTEANAKEQNPIVYGAGKGAEKLSEYATLSSLLSGATGAISSGLGKIGLGGTATKGALADFLANQAVMNGQTALIDTLPQAIEDKQNGLSDKDTAVKALKSTGENAAWNAAFGVPGLVKNVAAASTADKAINAAKNYDLYTNSTDDVKKSLDPLRYQQENIDMSPENSADEFNKLMKSDVYNKSSDEVKKQLDPLRYELEHMNMGSDSAPDIDLQNLKGANDLNLPQPQDDLGNFTSTVDENAVPKVDVNKNVDVNKSVDTKIPALNDSIVEQQASQTPQITDTTTENGKKLSKLYTNTLKNSGILSESELNSPDLQKAMQYTPKSNQETMLKVADSIKNDKQGMINKCLTNSFGVGEGQEKTHATMQLYQELTNDSRAALESGDKMAAQKAHDTALDLISNYRKNGATDAGQMMQALSTYSHTPEGLEMAVDNRLLESAENFAEENPKAEKGIAQIADQMSTAMKDSNLPDMMGSDEITSETLKANIKQILSTAPKQTRDALGDLPDDVIEKIASQYDDPDKIKRTLNFYAATGTLGVSQDTLNKAKDIFAQAQNYNINSKQYMDTEKKAYHLVADEMSNGKSFKDKFDEWRYFSMLANPVTHIKNITGNVLMRGLSGLKNNLAAIIESAADSADKAAGGEGIERTKSLLNPLSSADNSLINASKEDAYNTSFRELSGNKFNDTDIKSGLDKVMPTWSEKNAAGRTMNKLSSLNNNALDAEDTQALIQKYKTSLAGYLKANGADSNIFSATDDASKELLEKGRAYAIQQAKEAAFHQDTGSMAELAGNLTEQSRKLSNSEHGLVRAAGGALDVVIPFKKTPSNIIQTIGEYSPAELLKTIPDASAVYKGTMPASQFIDDLSKGLTGTAGIALGAALASKGVISTGYSKGDKESNFDKTTGKGSCAIHLGNKSYSIDEFAPASMPIIIGGAIYEAMQSDNKADKDALNVIADGLSAASNSMIDTTMLSGLLNTFTSVYNSDDKSQMLPELASSIGTNLASQAVPTLGGRLEKIIDPTARSSYSSSTGIEKTLDSNAKYLATKLPYSQKAGELLSNTGNPTLQSIGNRLQQQPKIDLWGNEKKNTGDNAIARAGYYLLSPGQYNVDKSDKTDNEIRRLYNATGDEKVFPSTTVMGDATINKEKLSPEQFTKYSVEKGKLSKELMTTLVSSDAYKNMSDADRSAIVEKIYDYARKHTKADFGANKDSSTAKIDEAYKSGGASAAIDYINMTSEIKAAGASNNDKMANLYKNGGIDAVKQYSNLDNIAKSDKTNVSKSGEQESFSQSDLGEELKYTTAAKLDKKSAGDAIYTAKQKSDKGVSDIYNKYGSEGVYDYATIKSQASDSNNRASQKMAISVLRNSSMPESEKASMASAILGHSSKKASEVYDDKGEEGLYQYYTMRTDADTDGNGSLKVSEIKAHLDSLPLSTSEKRYWFSVMSSAKKNPY